MLSLIILTGELSFHKDNKLVLSRRKIDNRIYNMLKTIEKHNYLEGMAKGFRTIRNLRSCLEDRQGGNPRLHPLSSLLKIAETVGPAATMTGLSSCSGGSFSKRGRRFQTPMAETHVRRSALGWGNGPVLRRSVLRHAGLGCFGFPARQWLPPWRETRRNPGADYAP